MAGSTMDQAMQALRFKKLRLDEMMLIESHILSQDCPKAHPPLKELATTPAAYIYSNGFFNITSPLLYACYGGNLAVVQRFIEVWEVDIEARSSLYITREIAGWMGLPLKRTQQNTSLENVTPLFAAALNNNTEIVRYLVSKGADVSATTSTSNPGPFGGLTPLHGALLHGRLVHNRSDQIDVIRILLENDADPSALSSNGTPTWMFGCLSFYKSFPDFLQKGFCNVQAITLLVEHGMSIEQRCPILGRTLLHHMAGPANEFDDEKIVQLLLERGEDPRMKDKNGLTPIMIAAIGTNILPNMSILKFLMKRHDIPNMDKIEALEVATAILLSCETNLIHAHDIRYCLSEAQTLREIEGIRLVSKTPVNGRAVEWATSSDFEHIQHRPLELGVQSVLIRLRIFSTRIWETVYRYLVPYVFMTLQYSLTQQQQYTQILDISWTMLETALRFDPTAFRMNRVRVSALQKLIDTLMDLKSTRDPLFNFETLKTSFKLFSSAFQSLFFAYRSDSGRISCDFGTLRKLISILVGLPDVTIQPIAIYLNEIVSQNNEAKDQHKLIFVACMDQTESTCDIVRLLLKYGALPDAVDADGDGPLHILARSNGEFTDSIARVLLDAGAHFDRANNEGLTAADVWIVKREQENNRRRRDDQQLGGWRDLPDWLQEGVQRVPKLQCLSARIIRSRGISYKDVLPVSLQSFVAMH